MADVKDPKIQEGEHRRVETLAAVKCGWTPTDAISVRKVSCQQRGDQLAALGLRGWQLCGDSCAYVLLIGAADSLKSPTLYA